MKLSHIGTELFIYLTFWIESFIWVINLRLQFLLHGEHISYVW